MVPAILGVIMYKSKVEVDVPREKEGKNIPKHSSSTVVLPTS